VNRRQGFFIARRLRQVQRDLAPDPAQRGDVAGRERGPELVLGSESCRGFVQAAFSRSKESQHRSQPWPS